MYHYPYNKLLINTSLHRPYKSISIPKGVNSFAFCARANIIATGGNDKIVRIWHPHIFSRPTGKMIGHLFTIIDVAVNEKDQHVISLSTARVRYRKILFPVFLWPEFLKEVCILLHGLCIWAVADPEGGATGARPL